MLAVADVKHLKLWALLQKESKAWVLQLVQYVHGRKMLLYDGMDPWHVVWGYNIMTPAIIYQINSVHDH